MFEPEPGGARSSCRTASACTTSRSRTPRAFHLRPKVEQYDDDERVLLRRPAHRPLRRRARGGRVRRGVGLHVRPLRDHRPPGRRQRPARRAAAARAPPRAARRGSRRRAVGDPRQGRRRLRAGRRGPRARHRGGREDRLQRRRRRRPSASTCCAARRPTSTAPCTRCSARSTAIERGAYDRIGPGLRDVLPRRQRPPQARRRGGRGPARPAGDDPAGQHGGRSPSRRTRSACARTRPPSS